MPATAKIYEDRLDLTRVVLRGDVIKKSLRALGYVHFGETLDYRQSKSIEHSEHKMSVYLDCAIRDFLAAGGTLRYEARDKIDAPIYVAPILLVKKELHKDDEKIILNALDDNLRNNFSALTFADVQSVAFKDREISDEDFDRFIDDGRAQGCKYILIRVLRAKKIRDVRSGERLVTLEEFIFDANGMPLAMHTSGNSTEELTVFEAALATQESLNDDLKNFSANKSSDLPRKFFRR